MRMKKEMKEKGGWLSKREALALCREQGRVITKNGLIYVGKELDFSRKSPNGFHWEYEKRGLLLYIRNAFIPNGWISMEEFARKVGSDLNMVYYILRKYRLKHKRYGKLRGIIHVKERTALAAYKKYKGIDNVGKEKTTCLL